MLDLNTTAFELPSTGDLRGDIEIASAARRAINALHAAIVEPGSARHRVDISNALNFIETVLRQDKRS